MRTNVPIFKVKQTSVRRRYSDFKVNIIFPILMISTPGHAVAPRWARPHGAGHDAAASRQGLRQAAALHLFRRRDLWARVRGGKETWTGGKTRDLMLHPRQYLSRNLSTRLLVTPWCRQRDVFTCFCLSPAWTRQTIFRAKLFNINWL